MTTRLSTIARVVRHANGFILIGNLDLPGTLEVDDLIVRVKPPPGFKALELAEKEQWTIEIEKRSER